MCVEYDEENIPFLTREMSEEMDRIDASFCEQGMFKVVKCPNCKSKTTVFYLYNYVTDEFLPDEILCWKCDRLLKI